MAASGMPVKLTMHAAKCTRPLVGQLKDVLKSHPGSTEVHLNLMNGRRGTMLRLDDALRVDPSPSLMGDLKALLGPGCLG